MNDQPNMPTGSPNSFPGGSASSGGFSFVLVGVLGLAAIVFAVLALVFFAKYMGEVKTTSDQKKAAAAAAAAQQKQDDDLAATKANESPFRTYTAPVADGSFMVNFPKDWSSWLDTEQQNTQVMLVLNPNFVTRTNGQDDLVAVRVYLQTTPAQQFISGFSGAVTGGTMKQSTIVVSGQQAYNFTGAFGDHKTVREVVVPVRDKVLVFTTENSKYSEQFNEILAQAKVNP